MPPKHSKVTGKVTKSDLAELSEFRYRLRQFLRFSEEIVHAEGVTPLQYMLMLHRAMNKVSVISYHKPRSYEIRIAYYDLTQ